MTTDAEVLAHPAAEPLQVAALLTGLFVRAIGISLAAAGVLVTLAYVLL
jgi:hypothetical protein